MRRRSSRVSVFLTCATGPLVPRYYGKQALVRVMERIEVRSVTRLFGSTVALRGVSARFEPGAVTFIEGPNGAGKSTLLSVIGTALRPTSGAVDYVPFGTDPIFARPHIGWASHDIRAYRDLTGRENVELAARLYGLDPQVAYTSVIERVDAASFANQTVATLSRGQRQRIALAKALVHRPSVLLLDEPQTGLDAASSKRLETILIEERDRGTIVIVVSHGAGLVERVGGKRVRLERGRIAAIAT
jgi:heme exporter protein A